MGIPPYDFLKFNGKSNKRFASPSVSQKRLDLESLTRQTKAEELGASCPSSSAAFVCPFKDSLVRAAFEKRLGK
jgi:hypothetical protein